MEILVFNDVLRAVIKQEFDDISHKNIINKIFNNENSKFIYSKKMLEMLKDSIGEEDLMSFQSVATMLSDIGTNLTSSLSSKSMEEEAIHLNSIVKSNTILNIAYKEPLVVRGTFAPKTAILTKTAIPNYNWLVCGLAMMHPSKVTVNCWDFKNNKQIKQFFDDIFSLSKSFDFINIFDTQCNVGHVNFDNIIRKIKVGYYTKKSSKGIVGDEENYKKIKNKFLSNFKMFTVDSKRAHGRRIVFNNILVAIDNDYWNLEVNAQDWFIDVQINEKDADQLHLRRALYTPFISRMHA